MVATALDHLLPDHLTDDDKAAIADILDAAHEWRAGRMDWTAAASIGAIPVNGRLSEGYARFLAVRLTPASDPRRADLLALIDKLIDATGIVRTTQGTYTRIELGQSDAAVHAHRRRENA